MKLKTLPLLAILLTPLYMAACTTTNDITINPSGSPSSSVSASVSTSPGVLTSATSTPMGPDASPTPSVDLGGVGVTTSASPSFSSTPTMTPSSTPSATMSPTSSSSPTANPTPSASVSPGFVSIGQMTFTANLLTTEEIPSVMTKAKGTATITLASDQKSAMVTLNFEGLTGIQTSTQIQGPALKGFSAPGIISLPNGQLNNYMITLTTEQITWLKEGKLYLNVHSSFYPDGEIRGQLQMK